MVIFEALNSTNMFAFHFMAIRPFLAEIKQIPYLTMKIQGQGHGHGQTQWSHLMSRIQSICLLFVSGQLDHCCLNIANSIVDIGNSRSRSCQSSTESTQEIYSPGPSIQPKMKEVRKVVQKLSCEQKSAAGSSVRTGTKTKSPPMYQGDLITGNISEDTNNIKHKHLPLQYHEWPSEPGYPWSFPQHAVELCLPVFPGMTSQFLEIID